MNRFLPDNGAIRFFKVRDAGSVLNAIVAFVRQNARELFVGFFALVAPFAIIAGIGTALYFRRFGAAMSDPELLASGDPTALGEIFGPSYLVTIIGGLLAYTVALAAVSGYVRLYREGEAGGVSVGLLWDETKGLILPTAGMMLAFFFAFMLTGVIAIIPCLGALAWIGFWIWALPYTHVAFASRMTETSSLVEAVQRSRDLVKGTWGSAFGALVLTWLLSYAVIMVVTLPFYVIMLLVGINSVEASGNPAGMFSMMGPFMVPFQLLGMAAYILPTLAAFFVHGRLVQELEGPGLDDQLDLLAEGVDTSATATWDGGAARRAPASGDAPAHDPFGDSGAPSDDAPSDDPPGGNTAGPSGFRGGGFGA